MERAQFEPIKWSRLAGFLAGVGLFLLVAFRSEPGFIFLIDHANLLFHEAGHWVTMRIFKYRNLQMFFIPMFGAAV